MVAGYVRLSRDDDKKNYVSIENQKLLVHKYATQLGLVIDIWYEDDGVSGYSFNRPGFSKLLNDLDDKVDIVIAKDLSRIGRHNAKVLLLLDDFKERGKRLLLVDDNYDTLEDEDDIIGIKTWYNERYVKDTSKKIRKVMRARQEEGTLMLRVPFGYMRDETDKSKILVIEEEARCIRKIYELYLQGFGYRKIAVMLTEQGVPTPSMMFSNRYLEMGKVLKHKVTTTWSDGMVSEILKNDFYIGNYRTHKRTRVTINGTDKRVAKEDQNLFTDNHEPIIDKDSYELVQEIMQKRVRTNYRGQSKEGSIFGGCLFCKDCESRLTPILRSKNTNRKYYICNTYNSKGKRYCEHTHLINETDLIADVMEYIKICRNVLEEIIKTYDMNELVKEKESVEVKKQNIIEAIDKCKKQLKTLLSQKLNELSFSQLDEKVINETYNELQTDILAKIQSYDSQLKELSSTVIDSNIQKKLENALQVMDTIIEKGNIDRKDVEILVEKIAVDKDGLPEIELKYGLSNLISYNPAEELNKQENTIILTVLNLVRNEERRYTSAKYLSAELTKLGYKKSKKSILPYITILITMGILEKTEDRLKPYAIVVSKEELNNVIETYMESMSNRRNAGDGI